MLKLTFQCKNYTITDKQSEILGAEEAESIKLNIYTD